MEPLLMKNHIIVGEVVEFVKSAKVEGDCQPCVRAKGGQVFIFSSEGDPCRKDDWRPDQYRWHNGGVTKLPCHSLVVKKHYFYIDCKDGHSKGMHIN